MLRLKSHVVKVDHASCNRIEIDDAITGPCFHVSPSSTILPILHLDLDLLIPISVESILAVVFVVVDEKHVRHFKKL